VNHIRRLRTRESGTYVRSRTERATVREVEFDEEDLFDTPEAAALNSWASTPSAHPRVLTGTTDGDIATVVIETAANNSAYNTAINRCKRVKGGRWVEWGSTG
jgi:hypothetical protein